MSIDGPPATTIEHEHPDVTGGWLRPAVFGASDGLVSNLALIAGAAGHTRDQRKVRDQAVTCPEDSGTKPSSRDVGVLVLDRRGRGSIDAHGSKLPLFSADFTEGKAHLTSVGLGRCLPDQHLSLASRVPLGGPDEERDGSQEHDDRDPHVQPQAEHVACLHVVDAQMLDPSTPGRVARDIERERPTVAELEPAVGPDHQTGDAEVPDELVEERRVEGLELGVPVRPVLRVDLERPGHRGGSSEKLLVEPVPPPPERLPDHDSRGHRVSEGQELHAVATTTEVGAERTERDRSPYPESALPDVESGDRLSALAEVEPVVGDDVIQPAADQAERDHPDRDVRDLAGLAAPGDPPPLTEPDSGNHPGDDAQGVSPDREGPEVPDALVRARDGGEGHGALPVLEPLSESAPGVASPSSLVRSSARSPAEVPWVQTMGARSFALTAMIWVP